MGRNHPLKLSESQIMQELAYPTCYFCKKHAHLFICYVETWKINTSFNSPHKKKKLSEYSTSGWSPLQLFSFLYPDKKESHKIIISFCETAKRRKQLPQGRWLKYKKPHL